MKKKKKRPEKQKWEKQTFKLPPGLDFSGVAKHGYNIFVADRGAVAFSYPVDWLVIPGEDAIKFHDRKPPKDDCVLQVSVMRLPPVAGGWGGLPLARLVEEIVSGDKRDITHVGETVTQTRGDLEIAWAEVHFIDPDENRPARGRCCLARANLVQPLLTMDFWESDLEKFGPVWDEVLRTLRVGLNLMPPRPRPDVN